MNEHSRRRTELAVLVMLVTPLFFSTNLIFGRLVIPEVAPFLLATIRWGAVALALSPFLLRERRTALLVWQQNAGLILLLGFLGMWICGGGVYVALGFTTATNGTLIYTSSSVMIILLEAAFFGRAIGWREALGSLIAFLGIAAIVLKGDIAALAAFEFNAGDLIFVGAAVSWAVYSILYRSPRLAKLSNMALFAMVALAGALLLAPFAAWEVLSGQPVPATPTAWSGIAGIILFASLLAFSGFQFGARTLGPSLAGIFMYLMPPFGVGMAVLFLGEAFQPFHAAGIALVMGGVVLATFPAAWLPGRR
ncbi:MAG: DMT family transporter [Mesorhizobium sp.]|nr:DMT family transporter [Mesorhizobium sp.]